jgi:hypothetical protein
VSLYIFTFFLLTFFRRKKEARAVHERAKFAQKAHGLRAKLYNQKRFKEKAAMKKTYEYIFSAVLRLTPSTMLLCSQNSYAPREGKETRK